MPQLILVCEDDNHMAEVFREIVVNQVSIDKIRLYYTTDLRQNSDSLENVLLGFKLNPETNKYNIENIDLKLLEN